MNMTKEKIMRSCYASVETHGSIVPDMKGLEIPAKLGRGGGVLSKNKLKKKSMELNCNCQGKLTRFAFGEMINFHH